MMEGMVFQGPDGRVIEVNPAAETILGQSRDQLLGRTSMDPRWRSVREDGSPFPGDDHPAMVTLRTGKAVREELMGVHSPPRGLRWISINSQALFGAEGGEPIGVIVTFSDVTERRDAFRRIQQLAQRIETVREDERRQVARELHEGVAQDLFAAQLALKSLETQSRGRAGVRQAYEEIRDALAQSMDAARRMANNLRPAVFAHVNLHAALIHHVRNFAARSNLQIEVVEISPYPQMEESISLAFFRAAQETLTNIAKHAGASKVEIRLRADAYRLYIEIDDDGVGINEADLNKAGSLGLVGVRERFNALGGGFTIKRREPSGTRVEGFIPRSALDAV
jgi:PAS domain S-box-containing protein